MFSWENIEMFDGRYFFLDFYYVNHHPEQKEILFFRKILGSAATPLILIPISIYGCIGARTSLATMLNVQLGKYKNGISVPNDCNKKEQSAKAIFVNNLKQEDDFHTLVHFS